MESKNLESENEFTKRLPAYIRQYKDFFKFMKMLSNYIISSIEPVKTILNLLDVENSTGDVLEKVAKKVNVSFSKAYYNENNELDVEKYYSNLKTGIYGVKTKRLSNGTLYELKKSLTELIPNIEKIEIKDNMDMSVDVILEGDLSDIDSEIIEKYILPKVTGVRFIVQYILHKKNIFAFDENEPYNNKDKDMKYGMLGWDEGEWAPISIIN